MPVISTYLCEKNCLQREGLKSFLANTHFNVSAEFKCINEIMPVPGDPVDLMIIGLDRQSYGAGDACAEFSGQMQRLKLHFPRTRLVVLVSQEDCGAMPDILGLRADSYILKDISHAALLSYLNLAMMGENVFPSSLALFYAGKSPRGRANDNAALQLSDREEDIVRRLVLGESNKLIAKHLDIAEYTVKVHLKTILRKLGVQNRTQAALWARANGFDTLREEPAPSDKVVFLQEVS